MKRILFAVLAIIMCMVFVTGCGKEVVYEGQTTKQDGTVAENGGNNMTYQPKSTEALLSIDDVKKEDIKEVALDYATREPEKGETVAILHTNYGDIKMRFLDKIAPLASKNFIELSKAGRFDNTIFHRVIDNFMIQGGDYTNFDGTGGVSAFGVEFPFEISEYASNIRGSVAMAHAQVGENGSQFYINQAPQGNTYLDGGYTVFGWVYEGMDVVDEIAGVKTVYPNRPVEDVVIESVEVTEY